MIYTVGHGARSAEALVSLLKQAGIATLIDVRAYPGSKRHPQFSREPLAAALAAPSCHGHRVVHLLAPGREREHALNPQEELWRDG